MRFKKPKKCETVAMESVLNETQDRVDDQGSPNGYVTRPKREVVRAEKK